MKRFFHKELQTLRDHISFMGEKTLALLSTVRKALSEKDPSLITNLRYSDDVIDELEIAIDSEASRYLSLRAPVASDLRLVTVGMKISHELERAADEATSIGRRVDKLLKKTSPPEASASIEDMGRDVHSMLSDAIRCLLTEDALKAVTICHRDKEVDLLHHSTIKTLTQYIMKHPKQSQYGIEFMFISKSLERIADHATNIAEEVIFLHSGEDLRHTAALK